MGDHARHHLRCLLGQHSHVEGEAAGPRYYVCHSPLCLVLLKRLELAEGPDQAFLKEADDLCSAIRSERGAGRNSSISTYSKFQTLSTSFMGRVGKPFSTRYLNGFASTLSPVSGGPGKEASNGMMEANGLSSPPPAAAVDETFPPSLATPGSLLFLMMVRSPADLIVGRVVVTRLRPGHTLPPSTVQPLPPPLRQCPSPLPGFYTQSRH